MRKDWREDILRRCDELDERIETARAELDDITKRAAEIGERIDRAKTVLETQNENSKRSV